MSDAYDRFVVGASDILIGVIIYVILTLLLSRHHLGLRAVRLPSTLFIWCGTAQVYSAYREFCQQVWGRNSNQVKPWELDEIGDVESAIQPAAAPTIRQVESAIRQTESMASENLFTPMADKDIDFDLPEEVHPLTDLSGNTKSPDWDSSTFPVLEHDPEITEAARRELAIRRATVKVPDASLAFPIAESPDEVVASPTVPSTTVPIMDQRVLSAISPFDIDPEDTENKPDQSSTNESATPSAPQSLTAILAGFSRFSRTSSDSPSRKKVKIFGPERLVQDPRIKRLHEEIVRRIVVLASVAGVIWVAICLAVPNAGLG